MNHPNHPNHSNRLNGSDGLSFVKLLAVPERCVSIALAWRKSLIAGSLGTMALVTRQFALYAHAKLFLHARAMLTQRSGTAKSLTKDKPSEWFGWFGWFIFCQTFGLMKCCEASRKVEYSICLLYTSPSPRDS